MVDSLASGGDISRAVDETVSEVPELFRSVSAAVTKPVEMAAAPVVPSVSEVKGLPVVLKTKAVEVLKSNTPPIILKVLGGMHSWWTKDRLKSVIEGTVLGRETDGPIIQGSYGISECVRFIRLTMGVSIIPSRLRFIEGGQVRGRPARLAQDSRGVLVFLGSFGGLSCGSRQGMPKPRRHCSFDGEGAGGQAKDTARNCPGRRATGPITRRCVTFDQSSFSCIAEFGRY